MAFSGSFLPAAALERNERGLCTFGLRRGVFEERTAKVAWRKAGGGSSLICFSEKGI